MKDSCTEPLIGRQQLVQLSSSAQETAKSKVSSRLFRCSICSASAWTLPPCSVMQSAQVGHTLA